MDVYESNIGGTVYLNQKNDHRLPSGVHREFPKQRGGQVVCQYKLNIKGF